MRAVGIGAGGHGRVLVDALQERGEVEIVGLLDPDPQLKGTTILGAPVLGDDGMLASLYKSGVRHAFMGVGGTGDNTARRQAWDRVVAHGFEMLSVIHPSALVSRHATLGPGAALCAGSIVGTGARLGRNVIVNTGAIVEHDCDVGDHVHIASGAVLAGGVVVGEGAHVGAGASVRQGVRIGRGALVAMGAAVIADVPEGAVVAGIPARPLRAGLKT